MKKIFFYIILFLFTYIKDQKICEELPKNDACITKLGSIKYPTLCCLLTPLYPNQGESKICKTVPYSSYFSGYNKDYIDGILYDVKCPDNNITTLALEKCGKKNPKGLSDCKKYSTFVDSCCYFKEDYDDRANNNGKEKLEANNCYWLGSKYEGKIEWAGAKLECYNKKLNISLFTKILFILGIVLLF